MPKANQYPPAPRVKRTGVARPAKQTVAEVTWPSDIAAVTYANIVGVSQTPWDITVFVGQITTPLQPFNQPIPDRLYLSVEHPLGIRFAPAAALQLRDFLNDHLANFEASQGPITPVPHQGAPPQ